MFLIALAKELGARVMQQLLQPFQVEHCTSGSFELSLELPSQTDDRNSARLRAGSPAWDWLGYHLMSDL